jgi:hypothetical protein
MKHIIVAVLLLLISGSTILPDSRAAFDFRQIVEDRLKERTKLSLIDVCPIGSDSVADRVFRDYGAIFISKGTVLPPTCIFETDAHVQQWQGSANPETRVVGGVTIELQKPAMEALIAASDDAAKVGLAITPRGGSSAAARSYSETVRLWKTRFIPGVNYWMSKGLIGRKDADAVRAMPIHQQIQRVLEWERQEPPLYFSKDLSKSILYSVAAPGASQHVFMLALDVEQYANRKVRDILANRGWFQTVQSDMPHFTYLGLGEDELRSNGLKPVSIGRQTFWIPDM